MDSHDNTAATLAAKLFELINAYGLRQGEARRAQDEAASMVTKAEELYRQTVLDGGDELAAASALSMAREKLTRCQERARALALDPAEYRARLVEQDGPHRALALELDAMAEAEGRALVAEIEAAWENLACLREALAQGCADQRGRLLRLGDLFTVQDQARALLPRELRTSWSPGTIFPPVLKFNPQAWPMPARSGKLSPGPLPTSGTSVLAEAAKPDREMPACAGRTFATGTLAYVVDNAPAVVGVMSTEG